MQLNQNEINALKELEFEWLTYVIMFDQNNPLQQNNLDIDFLKRLRDKIQGVVNRFETQVKELQASFSFGSEHDKKVIASSQDQIGELKTYIGLLSKQAPTTRLTNK